MNVSWPIAFGGTFHFGGFWVDTVKLDESGALY